MDLLKVRNQRADVPVHWPLLIPMYFMLFLICFDFVMLFWLKSSLVTAARQIAVKAATTNNANSELDITDDNAFSQSVQERCIQAAGSLNTLSPGYNNRVRNQFLESLGNQPSGRWLARINDETDETGQTIRNHPIVQDPNGINLQALPGFFNETIPDDHNRCFAVINENNQVTFHVNIHCDNCWPILSRFLGFSGYLEGRGSHVVLHSGTTNSSPINKSLNSFAVVPRVTMFSGITTEHPSENVWMIGTGNSDFAFDQSNNTNISNEIGINSFFNDGELDFMTILGIRLAIRATDVFGNQLDSINSDFDSENELTRGNRKRYLGLPQDFLSLEFQGRSALEFQESELIEQSGGLAQVSITDLDGEGGALITRNNNNISQSIVVKCNEAEPANTQSPSNGSSYSINSSVWYGPYQQEGYMTQDSFSNLENLHNDILENRIDSSVFFNPIDLLMPHYAVCSVCGLGSPRAGLFGRCRSTPTTPESTVTSRLEWWTNSSYQTMNPLYTEIECKYRKNCREAHCCSNVPTGELQSFCSNRPISGGNTRSRTCSRTVYYQNKYDDEGNDITPSPQTHSRTNKWRYEGVPNFGFPECSDNLDRQSECCTVQVQETLSNECSSFCSLPSWHFGWNVSYVTSCSSPTAPIVPSTDLQQTGSYTPFRLKNCIGRHCFFNANNSPNNGVHGYAD